MKFIFPQVFEIIYFQISQQTATRYLHSVPYQVTIAEKALMDAHNRYKLRKAAVLPVSHQSDICTSLQIFYKCRVLKISHKVWHTR